jgi:hypothetical protein
MRSFGHVRQVGIKGTGSYGAGVTRHLHDAGIEVFEVDRPDRSDRRLRSKSDTLDAESAARAVLAGRRTTTPKTKDGLVVIAARSPPHPIDGCEIENRRPAAVAQSHRLGAELGHLVIEL